MAAATPLPSSSPPRILPVSYPSLSFEHLLLSLRRPVFSGGQEHYHLGVVSSFIGASLHHDLSTVDDIGGISRNVVTEDSSDNDDDSAAVVN
ncbi:Protein kinase domain-containing protein [Psidium guajava]|nr:Protein kinase domain-containing protein [Psidium guajava]